MAFDHVTNGLINNAYIIKHQIKTLDHEPWPTSRLVNISMYQKGGTPTPTEASAFPPFPPQITRYEFLPFSYS